MGTELKRRGLSTRILLGDTAHGTPAALDFIRPALADPDARAHVGAVGFHTWRGCTENVMRQWSEAARGLGVPLLVTEAGPDAHLHEYPSVRIEPWFQLQEIDLYLRVCAHAQPATIMEWQLTTDYSVLKGGGVYGEPGPLEPTQRFWNLKQLGMTPPGARALPITCDQREVTAAAFGTPDGASLAVHLVNNGGQRRVLLRGLPESVSALRRFVTDATRGMKETERVEVRGGKAEFVLSPASYTTLLGDRSIRPSNGWSKNFALQVSIQDMNTHILKPRSHWGRIFAALVAAGISTGAQEPRSATPMIVTIEGRQHPVYPTLLPARIDLPSPGVSQEGAEYVLVQTAAGHRALVLGTVENGPLQLRYGVEQIGKGQQLKVDGSDFPTLAGTGLHSSTELERATSITRRPVEEITRIARPGKASGAGFLAADEDIISVLKGDNELVRKLGLRHSDMARPLFHVWNLLLREYELGKLGRFKEDVGRFWYGGNVIHLRSERTKGFQESIFNDEINGAFDIELWRELGADERRFLEKRYAHRSAQEREAMIARLTRLRTGEMEPYYVMRYGFYEGHTTYRVDPITLAVTFGLKTLAEVEEAFPGALDQVLTNHFQAPANQPGQRLLNQRSRPANPRTAEADAPPTNSRLVLPSSNPHRADGMAWAKRTALSKVHPRRAGRPCPCRPRLRPPRWEPRQGLRLFVPGHPRAPNHPAAPATFRPHW